MRSSLISSVVMQYQQRSSNDKVAISTEEILKTKPKTTSNESRSLLENYQPDLVRDVPENAVGSPETPSEYRHSLREKDRVGIVDDCDNDSALTKSEYDAEELEELEEAELEDEGAALLSIDTKTKNKNKTTPPKAINNKVLEHDNSSNSSPDIRCFSFLKDLLNSVVVKPLTLGRFYGRKVMPKDASDKTYCNDDWEIEMDEIEEMHWIGSGAQGAVFLGRWRNQEVAIKKVRTERDTEIKHLRNLDHKNIVKFRYVYFRVLADVLSV